MYKDVVDLEVEHRVEMAGCDDVEQRCHSPEKCSATYMPAHMSRDKEKRSLSDSIMDSRTQVSSLSCIAACHKCE